MVVDDNISKEVSHQPILKRSSVMKRNRCYQQSHTRKLISNFQSQQKASFVPNIYKSSRENTWKREDDTEQKKQEETMKQSTQLQSQEDINPTSSKPPKSLKRKGSHKLVARTPNDTIHQHKQTKRGIQGKAQEHQHAAKRIKVQRDEEEMLTDFAYKVKPNRLVRVQNENTPICQTFLRGLTCTDEHCLKRHDVPMEYARPICHYFQQQGMCFKEDCVFRHVKVNPRATTCPSFTLLGYCENPECTMKHIRNKANT